MDEYIRKQDAFDVLTDYYHHTTDIQRMALKEALDRCEVARFPICAYDRTDFLEFLYNVIQPNEMERYLDMYHAQPIAQDGGNTR